MNIIKNMKRKQKLILNTWSGLINQIVTIICGLILPRYMLLSYGSGINGLVSSITHFLSFISLLEMGIGPVIQANLYQPLANKDKDQISRIVITSEHFFRRIALIFLLYILFLSIVFPKTIDKQYEKWFTISLLLIISISIFAQYYFGITYQLLLNADQKSYIQIGLQIITLILNTVISIVLMSYGASIHLVKLLSSLIYVIRPLGLSLYVHNHYNLNKNLRIKEDPIKQKWNGFSQHLAAVISGNIDIVALTFFSTLQNVSIYSVYFLVINGVTNIIMSIATGLEAFLGNIIAKGEKEKLKFYFNKIEFLFHTLITIVFSITAITIVPFISVYTRGIDDVNYAMPQFGILLVCAYGAQCLRVPYFRIIKAAGHFKQTQNGAFISAGINVVLTFALVRKYGLIGVGVGTLIAMLYHTFYFVWYLRKNIIFNSMFHFLYYFFTDIIIGIGSFLISKKIIMIGNSYRMWIYFALKISIITLLTSLIVNIILQRKQIMKLFSEFPN